MALRVREIREKFPDLILDVIGNIDATIAGIGSLQQSQLNDILFIFKVAALPDAYAALAQTIVVPSDCKSQLPPSSKKTFLLSPNPEMAMALISREYFAPKLMGSCNGTISERAHISSTAKISKNVSIGPFSFIGENVVIGEGAQISSNCVIENDAKVGAHSKLYPFVFVGMNCVVGRDCVIQAHVAIGSQGFGYAHDKAGHIHKPHLGRVILGERVEVGAGTMIDRGTIDDSNFGDGTKIDNLCHFGHNATFGKNCLITAGFVSAGSIRVGDNFVCGGRTTIAGHLQVSDNVTIAAHSTVGQSHHQPGQFGGYPLVPMQTYMRNLLTTPHLAEMQKNIMKLLKKIFPDEVHKEGPN
ncbi:MAG: UDP-3-O-(3-hydroxymyristoyl)glucosamine N-acyltransferase [Pseudomonadota bacterium]|mgnify:CR=1 FL=1|nr:UDP-3-O-(3-hydroxymyristoyl)glucosamine N-acyltransferase [Pseudomonadota bacterium]